MQKLIVSTEVFTAMLQGLIASGCTFEAEENSRGDIVITFTGGY
mgnify:CR=1 FL=1